MAFTPEYKGDFKKEHFQIEEEGKDAGEIRVVKLDTGPGLQVKEFSLPELQVRGKGEYAAIKKKYGPLAVTDKDRKTRGTRDNRFEVNPLLRDPLAIEEEEKSYIEARVREKVTVVQETAWKEGEKKGYEDGLKRGRDEAYDEFKSQAEHALQSFESMVKSFESLKAEVFKANERFLMELVFRVAKMVALKELSTDEQYVLRLSKGLLDSVGIRENVKLRINPKDAKSIDNLKAELSKTFVDLKNLTIEASDEVQGGGCKIETQWSAIDASIETQLKGLHEALNGAIENPKA